VTEPIDLDDPRYANDPTPDVVLDGREDYPESYDGAQDDEGTIS
jgi:hypothetical protein